MRHFFTSLLLTIGIVASAFGAVCPESLPSHQSFLSAEKEIADSLHNPSISNAQDDLGLLALIEIDSFSVQGCSEPFYVYAVVDLRSGEPICIIAAQNAYIGDFCIIQSPTGLEIIVNGKDSQDVGCRLIHGVESVFRRGDSVSFSRVI